MPERAVCQSCGVQMEHYKDHAGEEIDCPYCADCAYEDGSLKPFNQTLFRVADYLVKKQRVPRLQAEKEARAFLAAMPAWKRFASKASSAR
jgi:hypothetical protein